MTAALPKGLLANTENISGDLERIDHVEIEDLTQLWRGSNFPGPLFVS